ncbi:DM13 domain-containing protein [Jannaschia aquimarina]|uniref:Electron transfer DM13 n=1 Tax=Jannaschia aquimarina TaxID=935700 RepID=A0A0D1EB24_9RHOB|nr:DM13 domain-containing protein [Jannaschia aquimarina]KIT14954.1 Electron transfer DM13 [Jannaschia aquimarina]SNS60326.1 Electron transfer DM13 [Jannaschia aquimarina]
MHRRTFLATAAALGASPALAGGHGRLGTFTGAARYGIGGTAEIADGRVNLLDDFVFGSAPDPKVALGRDGYDPATLMGPLKSTSGTSSYEIPAGINPDEYNEVWIWCERFNVPLGVAKLGS